MKAEESTIFYEQQSKVKIDEEDIGRLEEEDEVIKLGETNEDNEEKESNKENINEKVVTVLVAEEPPKSK